MSKKFQPVGVGMVPTKTELGEFVRARRLKLGLKQAQLNKRIPRSGNFNQLVSLIETGGRNFLDREQAEAMARELQVDPEEILRRIPTKYASEPKTELGRLVRTRREELGVTLQEISLALGISLCQVKYLETGKRGRLSYKILKPLAKVLSLEISALAPFVGYKRRPAKGDLGVLVCRRREELGLSQQGLAEKIGVTKQCIHQIESGLLSLRYSDSLAESLAEALSLDISQLNALRPIRKGFHRHSYRISKRPTLLGDFLTKRRRELGLTQRMLAELARVSGTMVSNVERGDLRISDSAFERLIKALDCEVPAELI